MKRRVVASHRARIPAGTLTAVLLVCSCAAAGSTRAITCDADSDCYYLPAAVEGRRPAVVVLHCNGAKPADLDSFSFVGDSLGWVMAACGRSRNHRDLAANDNDIVRTIGKLLGKYPVDSSRVFLFGYSGQGVQALATMFLHPELVRGVATTCAHSGAMPMAVWEEMDRHSAYLITRQQDWNYQDNLAMAELLNSKGIVTELDVTGGEHEPGGRAELLRACAWLDRQSRK